MDQGYLRSFLKFAGYGVLAIIVFVVLLFVTQDENEIESFFSQTQLTEQIYDYWDWKRFQEDFVDVRFTGRMTMFWNGDTSGLGIVPRYYQYRLETRYKEFFTPPIPYVNLDNHELLQRDEGVRALAEHSKPNEIGVQEIEIQIRYMGFGPILYKVITKAGTEANRLAFETTYVNLTSVPKLQMSLESAIDRELKSWAKRFFKMQGNDAQLKELYRSIGH